MVGSFSQIAQKFMKIVQSGLDLAVESGVLGSCLEIPKLQDQIFIMNPYTHRLLKKFIQYFTFASELAQKIELEKTIESLVDTFLGEIGILIHTKAVFILIALLENSSYGGRVRQALGGIGDLEGIVTRAGDCGQEGMKILWRDYQKGVTGDLE
jgi:hypothetical protein